MNPFGAIATLIVGVAGALYLFTRRASEAQRAQVLLNEIHRMQLRILQQKKNRGKSFV